MNALTVRNSMRGRMPKQCGTTLLEVLIAIVIFAVGMIALASLQGNLTRSSSDSNMRTVAANIAEKTIEGLRAFEVITSEPGKKAYDDIADTSFTESRGGVVYTVDVDVTDYYFLADRESVSKDAPEDVTASSFKYVDLTVTWNTGQEFQIDDSQSTGDRLGSGNMTIASVIPSIPALNNARVAAEDDGALGYPPVNYTPGLNPDIVAINLGNQKFKESTTPEPIVRRRDELMETWFDVVTYTTNGNDAIFLRREEFVSISCECTLHAAESLVNKDGRKPTLWTGSEYAEAKFASKPFGVSASNQQSQFCDVCCRDHHDTDTNTDTDTAGHDMDKESYRPNATFTGDHPHYSRSNQGVLQLAAVGDDYLEACRLVRKDGFFRVAQDFDLQNQIAFPENFLDQPSEVEAYSAYVTAAVQEHFFPSSPPVVDPWDHSAALSFDGDAEDNRTVLDETDRQYRSRGVYTDVPNAALAANLANCFDNNGDPTLVGPPACTITEANSPIEVLPFFDVQLTQLARWTETNQADPIDVSNEEISNNGYSRGRATLAGSKEGDSTEHSTIETGNVGLISILPVRKDADTEHSKADLFAVAGAGGANNPEGITISGSISNAKQTGNAVPSVAGAGANCTRPDNATFVCVLDAIPSDAPTITISNYYRLNTDLIACASAELTYVSHVNGTSLESNQTVFLLPTAETTINVVITIVQGTSCP